MQLLSTAGEDAGFRPLWCQVSSDHHRWNLHRVQAQDRMQILKQRQSGENHQPPQVWTMQYVFWSQWNSLVFWPIHCIPVLKRSPRSGCPDVPVYLSAWYRSADTHQESRDAYYLVPVPSAISNEILSNCFFLHKYDHDADKTQGSAVLSFLMPAYDHFSFWDILWFLHLLQSVYALRCNYAVPGIWQWPLRPAYPFWSVSCFAVPALLLVPGSHIPHDVL